jgi:hypothetical protein
VPLDELAPRIPVELTMPFKRGSTKTIPDKLRNEARDVRQYSAERELASRSGQARAFH